MRRLLPTITAIVAVVAVIAVGASGCGPSTGTTSTGTAGSPTGAPATTAAATAGDHDHTLTAGGRERSFVVHVPAGLPAAGTVAAVLVLHGGGGDARQVMAQTGMSRQADRAGFLAVYPNGTGRLPRSLLTWNSGACCGYALDENVDDVAFLAALIDDIQRRYRADPRRIFVTGMSNGAMMSYRLACQLADRIAAIAPVAGSLGVDCRPSAPVSVVAFHGTADGHVPYLGGTPTVQADPHPRRDPPVADTIAFWARHDGCTGGTTAAVSADTTREVHPCPGGVEVALYTIDGGGHAWPGSPRGAGADQPTGTISATELIWEFFERHPR